MLAWCRVNRRISFVLAILMTGSGMAASGCVKKTGTGIGGGESGAKDGPFTKKSNCTSLPGHAVIQFAYAIDLPGAVTSDVEPALPLPSSWFDAATVGTAAALSEANRVQLADSGGGGGEGYTIRVDC